MLVGTPVAPWIVANLIVEATESVGDLISIKTETSVAAGEGAKVAVPSVLVVDDSMINCLVLRYYLAPTNYRVDEAHTGAEALAKVKDHRYDFIVMDLLMPEMDGFEAMREIRCWEDEQGAAPTCIIIALTGWELREAEMESLLCGADAHLTKPISQTRLLDILDEHRKRQS